MISSGATFYLREAPRGSVHSLKEEKEERNENIPSIQDLLEKYQRYRTCDQWLRHSSPLAKQNISDNQHVNLKLNSWQIQQRIIYFLTSESLRTGISKPVLGNFLSEDNFHFQRRENAKLRFHVCG